MRFFPALVCLLVFTLFPAFAQQPPKQRLPFIGTVESVSGDTIRVKTAAERLTLYADGQTAVWKGRKFHDFSHLRAGDAISVDARRDFDGRVVAISIWANYTNFCAVVTSGKGRIVEVSTYPDADVYSGYRKEKKSVLVDADTVFESGSAEDMRPGRIVWVVGLDLRVGQVQATRIAIVTGPDGGNSRTGTAIPLAGPRK